MTGARPTVPDEDIWRSARASGPYSTTGAMGPAGDRSLDARGYETRPPVRRLAAAKRPLKISSATCTSRRKWLDAQARSG